MVQKPDKTYLITYHFDTATLSSEYETEKTRDAAFKAVSELLQKEVTHMEWDGAIINVAKCIYITKEDKWKYQREGSDNTQVN